MPLQRMDVVADAAFPAGYDVIEDRPEIELVNRIRTKFVKVLGNQLEISCRWILTPINSTGYPQQATSWRNMRCCRVRCPPFEKGGRIHCSCGFLS